MQVCSREDDILVDLEKCCKMRIWTRKSALIQRRTSLGKSDIVHSGAFAEDRLQFAMKLRQDIVRALSRRVYRPRRSPRGCLPKKPCQILAKSSQTFASNIAFFSIFQNLQDFTKFCKNLKPCTRRAQLRCKGGGGSGKRRDAELFSRRGAVARLLVLIVRSGEDA